MTLLKFEMGEQAIKKMYEFMRRHYVSGGEWNDTIFDVFIDTSSWDGRCVIIKGDNSMVFQLVDDPKFEPPNEKSPPLPNKFVLKQEPEWHKMWNDEGMVGKGEAAEYAVNRGVQAKYHPSLEEAWKKDEETKALLSKYGDIIDKLQKENNELIDKLETAWGPHHVKKGAGGGELSGGG